MGGRLDMSKNPPMSHSKDFFSSPALTLSLAGIFRDGEETATAGASAAAEVEERDEGSRCGGGRREEAVEISSETSGPARSRPEDDLNAVDSGGDDNSSKKKRKKYHRHTSEQIREMEALFKESPHPDEKQRQQLSKQLGLHSRQVKFWFQNRRTQIKAMQERHENSLLKSELEKLCEENKVLRETINKARCLNCGFATSPKDGTIAMEEQQLRIENTKLKSEVEKLQASLGKFQPRTSPTSSSMLAGNDQESRKSLDFSTAVVGLKKSRIMDIVNQAMDEFIKMGTLGEPLWIRSLETGCEILNYDEYLRVFSIENSSNNRSKRSIEASRESGIVFADLQRLVQSFMDVNQWKEMFPCMISKAATVYFICDGNGANKDGAAQLIFAELQMLTPLVSPREVYFVRYSKQLDPGQWVIVDVSVDNIEDSIDASLSKCRKRPSGCIIKDESNGHCKVIWVEHLEWKKSTVNSMYRAIVNSGLAFGSRRWMASLQLQCEWIVFFMATNVPTKDSSGVSTLAGRKSILKLAQRMTWNFCVSLGASNYNTWNKVPSKTGNDIRVASRKNINDPAEPLGMILCAVSSVWLPVSHHVIFDFLRDETRKNEWDVMSNGGPVQSIANLAKGQDRGNAVTIQRVTAKENSTWMLQDSSTNSFESMVVYSPVDTAGMHSVMRGCDSSNVTMLPSGFSILPDGLESKPSLITSKPKEKSTEGGSLLTVAFQILASTSPATKPTIESVESVNTLLSCTLQKIKTSLQCEDG